MNQLALGVSKTETHAPTTKYDLVHRITKDLAEAERVLGWYEDKIETGHEVMGDKSADHEGAKRMVESLKTSLSQILSSNL